MSLFNRSGVIRAFLFTRRRRPFRPPLQDAYTPPGFVEHLMKAAGLKSTLPALVESVRKPPSVPQGTPSKPCSPEKSRRHIRNFPGLFGSPRGRTGEHTILMDTGGRGDRARRIMCRIMSEVLASLSGGRPMP